MNPELAEAIELLEYAMYQGCDPVEATDLEPIPGQPVAGEWIDTSALGAYRDIGDYLVKHAGWERHPSGVGRRQFYRPPETKEPQ